MCHEVDETTTQLLDTVEISPESQEIEASSTKLLGKANNKISIL
jgi:hypothetical protein